MLTCAECSDLLLDFLYGLLDEKESETLRNHLDGCPACQEALGKAKIQQNLFARAARKYREVPAFQAPSEGSPVTAAPEPPQVVLNASAPAQHPRPRPRPLWRRLAPLAAAAAILITVGTVFAGYQQGLNNRLKTLADARGQIEALDAKVANLPDQMNKSIIPADTKLVQLQLLGPATYQPGIIQSYRLTTATPQGRPAAAKVTVKLLDDQKKQVLFREEFQSAGELQFVLPARLPVQPGTAAQLVVEAQSGLAIETVEQPLPVVEPAFVTHLALNKTSFKPGDTLFFRTVTLDRFALTPADKPLTFVCGLYRAAEQGGALVKQLECTTGSGGVSGGDFVLADDLPQGDYLLAVTDIGSNKAKMAIASNASQLLRIDRGAPPKNPAVAGGAIKGGKGGGKGGGAGAGKGAKKGGPVAKDPAIKVDFFPEGGTLVAGLTNRVYYRAQLTPPGTKDLEGIVEDSTQRQIAKIKLPTGDFVFTPQPGEVYHLRVAADNKVLARLPLPALASGSVTMSIPRAVVSAGQPITVQIRGATQSLLVLATCRGRPVDEKIVALTAPSTEVTLDPPAGCDGVMRVTIYTTDGKDWRPEAERLVYRHPATYLKLEATLPASGVKAGDSVTLPITSRNEAGALTPSWLFAMLVDDSTLAAGALSEANLPAALLLNTALTDPSKREGEGEGTLPLLPPGSPAAAKALDLVLATSGWQPLSPAAASQQLLSEGAAKLPGLQPVIFSARTDLRAAIENADRAAKLRQDAAKLELIDQISNAVTARQNASQAAQAAAADLADYQQLPMTWLRHAVAVVFIVSVVLGTIMLVFGLIVLLRAKSSPRLQFVGSFAAMLLAVVIYLASSPLRMASDADPDAPVQAAAWLNHEPTKDVAILLGLALERVEIAQRERQTKEVRLQTSLTYNGLARDEMLGRAATTARVEPSAGFGGRAGSVPALQSAKDQPQQVPGNLAEVPKQNNTITNSNAMPRSFANSNSATAGPQPPLLLWQPLLDAADGTASVTFDVAGRAATYRILIVGHTADGRLGAYEGKLIVGSK